MPLVSRLTMERLKQKRREVSYAKLNTLRKDAALCDVILKTADGVGDEMYVHRCVIASNSEYFEQMFVGAEENGRKSVVRVDGVGNDALRHLIDFIYTGELVTIDAGNVEAILNGAELLRLYDVRDVCTEFYARTIDDENCLVIKDMADSRVIADLSEKCLNHALKRLASVSDCAAFLNADVKIITQLIENRDVCYADQEENVGIKTYEAIMKWVKHDESYRKHLLPELLSSIKLTLISQSYFDQKIAAEPLIKSNPKCMEWFSKTSEYLKCGDASSVQFTAPKTKKKRGVPRVKCTEPNTPCAGKIAIDLHAIISDPANDFQNTEWTLLMNEENFLKEWDEEWEDVNGPWNEEYKHDW